MPTTESRLECEYPTANIQTLKAILARSRVAMQGPEDYVGGAVVGDSLHAIAESLCNSRDRDSVTCRYLIKELVKMEDLQHNLLEDYVKIMERLLCGLESEEKGE